MPAIVYKYPIVIKPVRDFGVFLSNIKFSFLTIIKSFWGIVYLLIFAYLSFLLARFSGVFSFLIFFFTWLGGVNFPHPGFLNEFLAFFTSNPITVIKSILIYFHKYIGSVGLGIVSLGGISTFLLLPALLEGLKARLLSEKYNLLRKLFGTTVAKDYLESPEHFPIFIKTSIANIFQS